MKEVLLRVVCGGAHRMGGGVWPCLFDGRLSLLGEVPVGGTVTMMGHEYVVCERKRERIVLEFDAHWRSKIVNRLAEEFRYFSEDLVITDPDGKPVPLEAP